MSSKIRRPAAIVAVPTAGFLSGLGLVILGLPTQMALVRGAQAEKERSALAAPRTWNDAAMATLEVPLAHPIGSPKHVPADYYYRIPVRPIYKSYPVYGPGREPAGYMDWLKQQEPVVVWDDKGNAPSLEMEVDRIRAGEIVFDAPHFYGDRPLLRAADVRDPAWYQKTGTPVTQDGMMPFARWIVREKGEVELGTFACGMCHTRVMPGGSVLKGAQGNSPWAAASHTGFAQTLPQRRTPSSSSSSGARASAACTPSPGCNPIR